MRKNVLVGGAIGYVAAVVLSFMLPEILTLFIPAIGAIFGSLLPARNRGPAPSLDMSGQPAGPLPDRLQPPQQHQQSQQLHGGGGRQPQVAPAPAASQSAAAPILPEGFGPVVEYLQVLEDMIISEGQQHNLDSEIVEKSLSLFSRVQRIIPLLEQLGDSNTNHTIRRLILKDLNGVINPFLRLSGEMKSKNRRMLLNGLKDVDSKISAIASTIEHKDLLELQTKAELIHQRYNQSEL
ncbi:conserved hypothetical protein [Paenibacillus curdlanolyticus YK9]|uniref:5-bromo-4-chloroindolyl phosphate hydrolysis protein n=1 Tax=Paenibacillus curdlanolyticus YK9 TaxID=717606 RepID=E0IAJ7_9BACL|nr:hypothetical protein [Paenibacillus curdlanolyticus]EFM10401.1 conserved hypothetical protein [Paenibacillus curdlanolyticus YK9]